MSVALCAVSLSPGCGSEGPFPYLGYSGAPADRAHSFAGMSPAIQEAALGHPVSAGTAPGAPPPASPATLTAGDGTGLTVRALRARGVVDGPLAFTELLFTFENPTDRRLEGRFELALPPGASVSRFAMKAGDEWKEAEVVERGPAQQVYETYLHQRIDPALLEHEAGSRFSARVAPIPPRATVELLVSYSHELGDPRQPYRIPLAHLPHLGSLEIGVRVGDQLIRRSAREVTPLRDFTVPQDEPHEIALGEGDMVVARVAPNLTATADRPSDLLVLVDTSASAAGQLGERAAWVAALARELGRADGPDTHLGVVAFDQTVDRVFDGRAADYGAHPAAALLLRTALGASDLEAALAYAGRAGFHRVLLVSDGVVTVGADQAPALLAALRGGVVDRLDAVMVGSSPDRDLLAALAAGGGRHAGVVLSPETAGPEEWVRRLGLVAAPSLAVAVDGASWVWPARLEGLQPGDHALVVARVPHPGKRVRITLRGAGAPDLHALAVSPAPRPLLERQLAQAEIARLSAQRAALPADRTAARAALRDRVVTLSVAHRVLTPETALLILDTDADYARFCIDRRALSDLLTVDATGLRVLHRSNAAAPAPAPGAGCGQRGGAWHGTGGAVTGAVVDKATGEPVVGATVVLTAAGRSGTSAAVTDEHGRYVIGNVPPGVYDVTVYYADSQVRSGSVSVQSGKSAAINAAVDTSQSAGEVIEIQGAAPDIDTTSTQRATTIDKDYIQKVPTGRTFESTVGAAAGASTGSSSAVTSTVTGVSFSGSTWIENQYLVDGVSTSDALFGGGDAPDYNAYSGPLLAVMRRIERGDREGALVRALTWHRQRPGDVVALVALGEALEARGSRALAARVYGSIVDQFPSRAPMRRFAAGRLARLGPVASHLRIDVLERAVALRPDQPTGYRLLAYAMLEAGQPEAALDVLCRALDRIGSEPRGRFTRARPLLESDAGLVAAALLAAHPAEVRAVVKKLDRYGVLVPMEPSLEAVLSWENDASDLDLHLVVGSAGDFSRAGPAGADVGPNVTDGFGPERVTVAGAPSGRGYHLWVEYTGRQLAGAALGEVQIIEHDGLGHLRIDTRPFVALRQGARVDLGPIHPRWPAPPPGPAGDRVARRAATQ